MPDGPGLLTFLNSGLVLALIGIAATLYSLYRREKNIKAEATAVKTERLMQRITDLEKQQVGMTASLQPISEAYKAMLIKELTHDHAPELDSLMAEIGPPSTLTREKRDRMDHLLEQRWRIADPLVDERERDAAQMLLLVVKRAAWEAELMASSEGGAVQTVWLPPDRKG